MPPNLATLLSLTTSLDKIMEDMDTKTSEAQARYINNLKNIQSITSTNIENYSKIQDLQTKIQDKKYNELLSNNGIVLQNTSFKTL